MQPEIGIDIVENQRIKLAKNFLEKFLTAKELLTAEEFVNVQAKREFCAGRWAAKEAIFKILSLNQQAKISLNEIEIGYQEQKPCVLNTNLQNIRISISHERNYSVAVAIYWGGEACKPI